MVWKKSSPTTHCVRSSTWVPQPEGWLEQVDRGTALGGMHPSRPGPTHGTCAVHQACTIYAQTLGKNDAQHCPEISYLIPCQMQKCTSVWIPQVVLTSSGAGQSADSVAKGLTGSKLSLHVPGLAPAGAGPGAGVGAPTLEGGHSGFERPWPPRWEVLRMRQAGAPCLQLLVHTNIQAKAPGKGRQTANHHGCLRHHPHAMGCKRRSMPGQESGRPACCPPPLGRPAGRVSRRIWVAPLVHNPTNGRGPEKPTRPLPKAQPRPPCRLGRV